MTDSPYYPPRAGFLSPVWNWLGRISHSEIFARLHFHADVTLFGFLGALFIPGMGVFLRRPFYGRYALAACAVYAAVFLVGLGFPIGNLAFTGLLCIHAVGFALYVQPLIREAGLFYRMALMLMMVAALISFVYWPLLNKCESGWLMPIQFHNRLIVLHVGKLPRHLERGSWVAYRYHGWQSGEIVSRGGVNLAPVLAVAGDEVAFTATNLLVNGVAQPKLEGMPTSGGFTVGEKTWFAWAEFGISGHGVIRSEEVANARVNQGVVNVEEYIGAPFRWWFWRNQKLP